MKKILLILIVILCCSCASTYTITTIGNVTAYTSNGDVLRKWEGVKLTESTEWAVKNNSFKTFGYNFYDAYTDTYIVINNPLSLRPCFLSAAGGIFPCKDCNIPEECSFFRLSKEPRIFSRAPRRD